MGCLMCKNGTMEKSTNTYFAQLSSCYVIIENVPCYKGNHYGKVVYPLVLMERIEEILKKLHGIVSKIFILDYTNAA